MLLDYGLALMVISLTVGFNLMTFGVATTTGGILRDGLIIFGVIFLLLGLYFLWVSWKVLREKVEEEKIKQEEDRRFRRQELELLENMLARLEAINDGRNKSH